MIRSLIGALQRAWARKVVALASPLMLGSLLGAPLVADSEPTGDAFGVALCSGGDIDGDGVGDLLVGDPSAGGGVWIFSGASGTLIDRIAALESVDQTGSRMAGGKDANGDAVPDVAVGTPTCVRLYSGADRKLSYTIGTTEDPIYARGLALVGDVNGDGRGDLALNVSTVGNSDRGAGILQLRSGVDGQLIFEISPTDGGSLCSAVSSAGDVDGDGVPDVLVGLTAEGGRPSSIDVYSGRSPKLLHRIPAWIQDGRYQREIHEFADVDGDSHCDILALSGVDRVARVFSGASGDLVAEYSWEHRTVGAKCVLIRNLGTGAVTDMVLVGDAALALEDGTGYGVVVATVGSRSEEVFADPSKSSCFGYAACGLEDVNNDGITDFAVSTFCAGRPTQQSVVIVFSGADRKSLHILSRPR